MLRLPRRLPYEGLIATGLLLGSCAYHSPADTYDLAETADVNARNALARYADLESRVSEIEGRLGM